ncbi:hypothetical protein T4E_5603 [Trichinella pseudospiralis]|nr:hypothetical protein T4E_5603 [Trichinella pseudospiralis]
MNGSQLPKHPLPLNAKQLPGEAPDRLIQKYGSKIPSLSLLATPANVFHFSKPASRRSVGRSVSYPPPDSVRMNGRLPLEEAPPFIIICPSQLI